jgi:peptidyl-tRNA hydrolase
MTEQPKMYIFINSDLDMTSGKIASQTGHVVHLIVDELVRTGYEKFPMSEECKTYMKWNRNCIKIVLKANTEQLKELLKLPNSRAFIETGQTTQVEQNSLTAIGFFPGALSQDDVKGYKLL